MPLVQFLTDFADQAVVLPLAAVIAVALWAGGWSRGALAWTTVIAGMLAVMLVLKLWAGTCGTLLFGKELQSPSGHTASAAAIYGGALALMLRRTLPGLPVGFLCAAALAVLVGLTRIVLGAHSVPEVVIGGCVGVAAAVILVVAAGPMPGHLRGLPAAGAVLAVVVIFHGLHLPAEAAIRQVRLSWMPFGLCQTGG